MLQNNAQKATKHMSVLGTNSTKFKSEQKMDNVSSN